MKRVDKSIFIEVISLIIINTKIVRTAREIANFINFLIIATIMTIMITARTILPSGGRLRIKAINF